MASAAEQLAANMNLGAFAKADELKKRVWFTLCALVVYRLGTYIPLPGMIPTSWRSFLNKTPAAFWACSICSPVASWPDDHFRA